MTIKKLAGLFSVCCVAVLSQTPRAISDTGYLAAGRPLSRACADASSAHLTLLISGSWKSVPTTNCSTAVVQFYAGGVVQPASGQTVTFSPNTICPPSSLQCFDESSTGLIRFSSPPPNLTPDMWGAVPGSGLDASGYFKSAIAAATSNQTGGHVSWCGNYSIAATVLVQNVIGLDLSGCGWIGTGAGIQQDWIGSSATIPIWKFVSTQAVTMHNVYFHCGSAHPCLEPIEVSGGGAIKSTKFHLYNFQIQCDAGYCKNGIIHDGPGGGNDFSDIHDGLIFSWGLGGAVVYDGLQSFSHTLKNVAMGGYATGPLSPYCVRYLGTLSGNAVASGSINGGGCTANTADIEIEGYSSQPFEFSNMDDETLGVFLKTINMTIGGVTVNNLRWSRVGGSFTDFFQMQGGSITFNGGSVNDINSYNITAAWNPQTGGSQNPSLTFNNLQISTDNITLATFFGGTGANNVPYFIGGCYWRYITSSNVPGYFSGSGPCMAHPGGSAAHPPTVTVNSTTIDFSGGGEVFRTVNTLATVIDTITYSGIGCPIGSTPRYLIIDDGHTSIANTGNIRFIHSSPYTAAASDILQFMCINGSAWALMNDR